MQEEMSGQELRQQLEALMGTTTEPASFDLWLGTVNFCNSQTKQVQKTWLAPRWLLYTILYIVYDNSISREILAATSICVPQWCRFLYQYYIHHKHTYCVYIHTISYHISYIIYHISYIIYHISYIIYHIYIHHISYICIYTAFIHPSTSLSSFQATCFTDQIQGLTLRKTQEQLH